MGESAIDVSGLTSDQKLQLLEELWDSLSEDEVPITAAQREELDRRLDDLDRDGPQGIPWEDVLKRLKSNAS
jgi:putative addiction module component (TIGR02574 family)